MPGDPGRTGALLGTGAVVHALHAARDQAAARNVRGFGWRIRAHAR